MTGAGFVLEIRIPSELHSEVGTGLGEQGNIVTVGKREVFTVKGVTLGSQRKKQRIPKCVARNQKRRSTIQRWGNAKNQVETSRIGAIKLVPKAVWVNRREQTRYGHEKREVTLAYSQGTTFGTCFPKQSSVWDVSWRGGGKPYASTSLLCGNRGGRIVDKGKKEANKGWRGTLQGSRTSPKGGKEALVRRQSFVEGESIKKKCW